MSSTASTPCITTHSDVIAIDEPGGQARVYPPNVVARLSRNELHSYATVAALIDAHPAEVLNVQHEYGLFGGDDGAWFADLIEMIRKPVVVSLHTVLPDPSFEHRALRDASASAPTASSCFRRRARTS